MKKISLLITSFFITSFLITSLFTSLSSLAQSPQKLSYQAIIRDAAGKLMQNSPVGVRLSIIQFSAGGTVIYTEHHDATTNVNGLVTLEIGAGVTGGNFSSIDWSNGPYFLKTETDPTGGTNYTIVGVSQLLSVPYALYSEKAGNGFSGDYNDLYNKPVTDGSETRIQAGVNVSVTGSGTIPNPYVINASSGGNTANTIILTSSQVWTVPSNVTKIKVEIWGAAGGGGGAGAYSYSANLNQGGYGGSGGYSTQEMNVVPDDAYNVVIGAGGNAGMNAVWSGWNWSGDTDGGNGGDSWFNTMKAAGGTGGKRGSFASSTVHGNAGSDNIGAITAYSGIPQNNILDVWQGLLRSYLGDRVLTSKPGKGGILTTYSPAVSPTSGENGCAVITLW